MSGSSPRQRVGWGSFVENVKPCMHFLRLYTPLYSSCLPLMDLIIRISWGWSRSFAMSIAISTSNLAWWLRDTYIRFPFSYFSSIFLFNTEKLIESCVLLLWYSQYRPFAPSLVVCRRLCKHLVIYLSYHPFGKV